MRVEQITGPDAHHGEGPVWHDSWGGLRWVDMLAGDVLSLDPDGTVQRWHVGSVAAAMRPRTTGGMVLALERGFALVDGWREPVHRLGELWTDPGVRMNEGGCDPHGAFYCGSMAYDAASGAGSLYRLDPVGTVDVVVSGVTISNGLAWSPDGSTAYYVDTPTQRVDAFDYEPGRGLSGRRTVIEVSSEDGSPDGLTVDSEGCLWVALWDGAAVRRYTPDGCLDAVVPLPVSRVTACTFGGAELDELYITTSRDGLDPGTEPEAGALFRVSPGVRGLPTLPYAG